MSVEPNPGDLIADKRQAYLCDINEAKILKAADNLQSLGLQAAGYNYINSKLLSHPAKSSAHRYVVDGCWSVKDHRDPVTHQILPNMANFPSGIAGLVSELHDRGFKVGIYSVAGSKTCAGYPGSLWHEDTDAATFAAWGIDCDSPGWWRLRMVADADPRFKVR